MKTKMFRVEKLVISRYLHSFLSHIFTISLVILTLFCAKCESHKIFSSAKHAHTETRPTAMKARRIGGRKNRVKRRQININTVNLHCFDDMTDEMGVTSAFLFTNLAILLSAKAMMNEKFKNWFNCWTSGKRVSDTIQSWISTKARKNVFLVSDTRLRTPKFSLLSAFALNLHSVELCSIFALIPSRSWEGKEEKWRNCTYAIFLGPSRSEKSAMLRL